MREIRKRGRQAVSTGSFEASQGAVEAAFSFAFFDLILSFTCIFPLMFYITFIPIALERTGERDIRKMLFYTAFSFLCVFCVKAVLYLLHILF